MAAALDVLAVVRDHVVAVGLHGVVTVAAVDRVGCATVAAAVDRVVAGAAVQLIGALAALDPVVAVEAADGVGAAAAAQPVVPGRAADGVVTLAALDLVVAGAAVDVVVSGTAVDTVVATVGVQDVVALAALDPVVTGQRADGVVARPGVDPVGPGGAGERVVAVGAVDGCRRCDTSNHERSDHGGDDTHPCFQVHDAKPPCSRWNRSECRTRRRVRSWGVRVTGLGLTSRSGAFLRGAVEKPPQII